MKRKFIFIIALIFFFASDNEAKSKTQIIGTVVAYEASYGHIYNDKAIIPKLLIVRVDEVSKGNPNSKYVLVKYYWRLIDDNTPYSEFASQWKFTLSEDKSCRSSIGKIQLVRFTLKGKPSGIMPRFVRTQRINPETIPFTEELPCYELKRGRFSLVKTFITDEKNQPEKDSELYVLERERWTNVPGAPLNISIADAAFNNVSTKNIVEYRLGCIHSASVGAKPAVIDKLLSVNANIKPKENHRMAILSTRWDEYMEQMEICYDKGAKFSVVEVRFADGQIWRANQ